MSVDEHEIPPPDDIPAVSAEELVAGDQRAEPRRYPSTLGGALFLLVLAALVVGVAAVVLVEWRLGTRIVGGSLIAAAAFRLLVPDRDAGMLAVRHRFFDATLLSGAGAVLVFLASSIPNQPGV